MEQIRAYAGPSPVSTIPLMKCFVRLKAVSRDGVVDQKLLYRQNPDLPCDRIVAIGVEYHWNQEQTPIRSTIHTIIPTQNTTYKTEGEMLDAFQCELVSMDPDEIYFFPDELPMWEYYATRAQSQCLNASSLKLERFKTASIRVMRQKTTSVTNCRFETRNLINMEAALQKKVFISVESYDLYTTSCHKELRKNPCKMENLITDRLLTNRCIAGAYDTIIQCLRQDMQLLVCLEWDMSMGTEYSNVSKASDTDLTDVVSRGEQIRVFNRLMHFNLDNHMYVNREKLGQKPLKFKMTDRPPTFRDPDELPLNTKFRSICAEQLQAKLEYYGHDKKRKEVGGVTGKSAFNLLLDDDVEDPDDAETEETKKHAKDAEEAEGGNVVKPSCGFFGNQVVCVYDFASLYPSIMMAFNLSYENVVFDEVYLDLPGVEYFVIPINKYETIVTANVTGIIPKMLRTFVDNRSNIKKRMKTETDLFRKKTLDFEQNSMKILCNGTYGFTGAEKNGALLALKVIMYMVTSLGRYLQKLITEYLGVKYGIRVIYGDTDSIFIMLDLPVGHETMNIADIVVEMGRKYGMSQPFTIDTLQSFFMDKKRVDISNFTKVHQIHAIHNMISTKLVDELTDLIGREPVKLEFENIADQVWMSHSKKTYCYRFWNDSNPSKVDKIKITGMAVKKRDWSPWTRAILMKVTQRLMNAQTDQILKDIEEALTDLVEGRVPIRDLMISKGFKDKSKYKNFRQVHLQVMLKLEERTRWPVKARTRLYFVIVNGKDKLYMRSETPEYAEEHKLELDLSYYLRNQFYNPMKKLLVYHPELFNFEQLFKRYVDRLAMKDSCQTVLDPENMRNQRLLTVADVCGVLKKPRKSGAMQNKSWSDTDPFSSVLNK
jgi:DNA polymerase elongation subunit (family B)